MNLSTCIYALAVLQPLRQLQSFQTTDCLLKVSLSFIVAGGSLRNLQAISVILTHRTDDNSKLPQLVSADDAKGKGTTAKETKRPKLRLQNAPPKPDQAAPVVATPAIEAATRLDTTAAEGPGPDAEEDWEDVAVSFARHSNAYTTCVRKIYNIRWSLPVKNGIITQYQPSVHGPAEAEPVICVVDGRPTSVSAGTKQYLQDLVEHCDVAIC